ncbi:MAG: glutamine synthetase III [Prevotellaceae bacterium]|jgi:glutamine synthetase|nr:glutamine synthetase III [Prevotellaceae bacterium]
MKDYAVLRFNALKELGHRKVERFYQEEGKVTDYFAINVFDREKMRAYFTAGAFEAVAAAIDEGKKIDRKVADQIAAGMKTWAIERGATHYAHWFHPLNDATAEKHDAFFEPTKDSKLVENFKGELLVQQEPDASSFPSGGLRNTFEARGYTAWDPSSPIFIVDGTLCIPTVFVSYTGEALDLKTPLLKSQQVIDKAATEVCQYFDKEVTKVYPTLGVEQEYFVVDDAMFNARPDLMLTGRTLMGHTSAKDQQLDDHYFGAIPMRVSAFMKDFETESYKLGIPIKTRHNEVAPHQFEFASSFEEANLAVDHNLLVMSLMKRIAKRHRLKVLFHEKPFAGVNGSGKHCNWSLRTNTGKNLLSPGKTPRNNLQFLTFFINTICAAHNHGYLMMASVANLSNSYRLGGHEAPPSMLSVFLGQTLSGVLDSLEERVSEKKMTPDEKTELKLDVVGKIPEILPDNTDRNRTSPFAFTGNRFEFRAVGSSCNPASPVLIINAAVAEQLVRFKNDVDKLITDGVKKDEAIFQVLRSYIIESKPIRFEGNGYSEEWHEEAKRRGLREINDIPESFKAFLLPESQKMFNETGVLSNIELDARFEIRNETLVKKLQIEQRVLGDMALNHIIPTAIRYQNLLIENIKGLKEIYTSEEFKEFAQPQLRTLKRISRHIKDLREKVYEMVDERKKANLIEDIEKRAKVYWNNIFPYLDSIRYHIDKLERIVDDSLWPLPKYREILFLH